MMKFTIEQKTSLDISGAQNSAQLAILTCNPANTFKVAFHFH